MARYYAVWSSGVKLSANFFLEDDMNYYAGYSRLTGELLGVTEAPPFANNDRVGFLYVPEGIDLAKVRWDVPSRSFKPIEPVPA